MKQYHEIIDFTKKNPHGLDFYKIKTISDIIDNIIDKQQYELLVKNIKKDDPCLVLVSWWMDSTALIYLLKKAWIQVVWLEFSYHNRPKQETSLGENLCNELWIELFKIKYPVATNNFHEIYINESNAFYIVLAWNLSIKKWIQSIATGQILSDWIEDVESSTGPQFYKKINELFLLEFGKKTPIIHAPLIYFTKEQIVRLGKDLSVPFEKTRSCMEENVDLR